MKSIDEKLYLSRFGSYTLTEDDKREIKERNKRDEELFEYVTSNIQTVIPLSVTWFRLLFIDYQQIVGPLKAKSLPAWNGMTDLDGHPLFMIKELDGKFYQFRGVPNPGFPGS